MDVIYVGQSIDLNWSIRRNASEVLEDFSRADLKVFLTGNDFDGNYDGKYYFANHIDEQGRVVLDIDPGSLTPGTYCIEGIWIKNSHELLNSGWTRSISRARKDRIFKVSDVESECTDYNEEAGHVVAESHEINIATGTTSYGYDGMSAYETAIFNGSTAKTEKEWIDTYEKAEDRVNYEMDESHDGSVPGEPQSWANAELKRKQAEGQLGSSDPYYSTSRKKKEEDRQTAESNRASAETSRGTAETQRQKNEGQMGDTDPDYATSRIKKENDRQTAESGRVMAENGRTMAEATRVRNEGSGGPSSAGYSTSRIKKELDRQSAESSRATAETSRQEYEGQGDYSDTTEYPNTRRAKEAARQTAETARDTAETARQKAEGQLGNTDPDYATSRIKQEIDRQAAEAARELAETARENAKISSTTIEYAVGDSGTTPPSSGWQASIPSYTTGDFLWGRTTMTFGDGTSKVLYAIGSVPDVAVSQNASTGKTTITVGSDSYDVATEPVSVSQNTNTKGQQLHIGGASVGNINDIFNVNSYNNTADAYTSQSDARGDVPEDWRAMGMIITYLIEYDSNTHESYWRIEQFVGAEVTYQAWTLAANWKTIDTQIININTGRLHPTPYASKAEARADVTAGLRRYGLSVVYLLSDGWKSEQYIGTTLDNTAWNNDSNWLSLESKTKLLSNIQSNKNVIYKGNSFVNAGVVASNGEIIDADASPYRRTNVIEITPNSSVILQSYGSNEFIALAIFGSSTPAKFQKGMTLPIQTEYGLGCVKYNNKTGHTLYIIATCHKDHLSECYVEISQEKDFSNDRISLDDIFIEKGVCVFSTKTYTSYDNLTVYPYRTYFVPVKENQMLFIQGGSYPSTFQVFASNENHEYIENLMNIRGADNKYEPDALNPYKMTIAIPEGVTMVGITNRNDEYLTPSIIRYPDDSIINRKIRPFVKDYNLSPQKGHIAFVVDGGYNEDTTLKALFDAKGVKAGWALLWPFVWPTLYGMGNHYDKYLEWQNEGHEIMVHSGAATTWNDQDYGVPADPAEQAAFAKMRFEQFVGIGWKVRGFCQLGSQKFSTEEQRKPVYNSFEYAFTRATNEITEPDEGAVMMPTDKPWNLGRSTLEVITLAQMKGLIDECATKKGLLVIYCHSWRIGDAEYPNQTWANFEEMIDYAKSKCVVDIPYNCIKSLYANHIE